MKAFIKNFFYSNGKPSAGKLWSTVFSILFCVTYIMRLCNCSWITDTLIGLILGSLATVVGLYTIDKKGSTQFNTNNH